MTALNTIPQVTRLLVAQSIPGPTATETTKFSGGDKFKDPQVFWNLNHNPRLTSTSPLVCSLASVETIKV